MGEQGRVEKAFQGYIDAVYGSVAAVPETQLAECRNAFIAGVHWMQVKAPLEMDLGDEPTEDDMRIMDEIAAETAAHVAGLVAAHRRR